MVVQGAKQVLEQVVALLMNGCKTAGGPGSLESLSWKKAHPTNVKQLGERS